MRPIRTITAVDTALSTSFCAVPAFIRVEPVSTSGPVPTPTSTSTSAGPPGSAHTSAVAAPASRATRSPASTHGVRPLAATPTTRSPARTAARATRSPSSTSSSAPSTARVIAASPPARWGTNQPGGASKVGRSSTASSTASRPDVPLPR